MFKNPYNLKPSNLSKSWTAIHGLVVFDIHLFFESIGLGVDRNKIIALVFQARRCFV